MVSIPGKLPWGDDVKVQGSTMERNDINLLETVTRACATGIIFYPGKYQVKKEKISYFGLVVSQSIVELCPNKANAISKLQSPSNKQKLQSFLGTINFKSTFVPSLTKKTRVMCGLRNKGVHFVWTSDMQQEFESIQEAITGDIQLIPPTHQLSLKQMRH